MSCISIWGSENVFLLSLFTDPASIEGFDAETSFLFWTTFRVFGLSCKQIDANWISLECWSWRSFATSVWRISFRESARPSGYKPEHFFFFLVCLLELFPEAYIIYNTVKDYFYEVLVILYPQDEVQHRRDEFARLLDEHEQVVRELRRIESSGELQALAEMGSSRAEEAASSFLNLTQKHQDDEWKYLQVENQKNLPNRNATIKSSWRKEEKKKKKSSFQILLWNECEIQGGAPFHHFVFSFLLSFIILLHFVFGMSDT